MDAQHTPGPWGLIGKQGTAIWAGDSIIATVEGARAFHSIARANAQLIAAAPDLLAALHNMLEDGDSTDRAQAIRAIAKATGAPT
jgi:hypothetical protein